MATSTNPDWDPILMACQKGQLEIVQELLNYNSNNNNGDDERYIGIVHHANAIGQTALHIATWWANVDIMKVLLEHGALISAQNTMTGATPLHCAIQSSQAALRKSKRLAGIELLLLQYKADPNQKDLLGRIPIDYLDEDDIDRKDILKLFVMASKHKIYECIEKWDMQGVLDECESNNNNNNNNKLPIYQDKTPLVYLLQQWCNDEEEEEENNKSIDDNNSFYSKAFEAIVVWEEDYEDVQKSKTAALDLLLETILNLWRQQSQQQQQQTATDDNDDSSKTTTTTTTTKLQSLQHAACQLKSTIPSQETLELVWLTIARRNYVTLAQWLVDNDVATSTDTTTSTTTTSTSIIQNRQGMTPLQFAARSGHLEMVELLLKEKNNNKDKDDDTNDHNNNRVLSWVNIHHKDQRGQTALDAARVNGHEDIVKILSSSLLLLEEQEQQQ